jgi:FMN phosphatase YigB (HAD superfamily)
MNKMKLKAVLLDIDETIVTSEAETINYFNEVLVEMISEKEGIEKEEAKAKVIEAEKKCIRGDAFFAAAHLGFLMDEVFEKSLLWMEKNGFRTYPDALRFIHKAHSMGLRLFTLTNNGAMGVLIKLLPSGLANRQGESLFEKFYGDDSLGDSKANSEVYKRFLEKEELYGNEVLMIGDNRRQDGENAIAGGIKNVAIIDRGQTDAIRNEGEMIVVNDLENLIQLIEKEDLQ